MDDFSDLLPPQAVFHDLAASSKKALFQSLSGLAERHLGLQGRDVAKRLADREKLGSTGFGGGVAIPHGKIDGLPVDLVFLLLSPTEAGVEHLKALARVSRRMRDRGFVAKLRGAGSADALYALFAGGESRDAA